LAITGYPGQSTDSNGTPLTGSKTAGADTGTGKTEVIIPVRAIDGGLHHQMIKQIVLHRFYVYPSRSWFTAGYTLLNRTCMIRICQCHYMGEIPSFSCHLPIRWTLTLQAFSALL